MMDLSLGGLLGAIVGAMIGGASYAALIGPLDGVLRRMEGADAEREDLESDVSLMRRAILGFDIVLCTAIGYWLGARFLSPALGAE